jgi:hypothetical protein
MARVTHKQLLAISENSVSFWRKEAIEATALLKGMHAKYHCADCCCYIADFLATPSITGSTAQNGPKP